MVRWGRHQQPAHHKCTGKRTDSISLLEQPHVGLDFRDLIDIEKRRRGRVTIVLPHNAMEQDRESGVRDPEWVY